MAAGLDNLSIAEAADPHRLMDGAGDVDVLLLDDVVALSDEDRSAEIRDVVRRRVRPGGLVAVTYRTTSAWAEVAPLRHLARQLGVGTGSGGDDTARFLEVLTRLRDGGARFIVDRPHVRDIVDELLGGGARRRRGAARRGAFRTDLAGGGVVMARTRRCVLRRQRPPRRVTSSADRSPSCSPTPRTTSSESSSATSPSDRVYRIDLFRRGKVLLDEDTRQSLLLDLELVDLARRRATNRAPAPRRRRRSSGRRRDGAVVDGAGARPPGVDHAVGRGRVASVPARRVPRPDGRRHPGRQHDRFRRRR